MGNSSHDGRSTPPPARGVARNVLTTILLVALALLLWKVVDALLLAFGGVLLAVVLRGLGAKVHGVTRLPMTWSTLLTGVVLLAVLVFGFVAMGSVIAAEMAQLSEKLGQGLAQLRRYLEQAPWGQQVIDAATQGMKQGGNAMSHVPTVLGAAVDTVLGLVIILFAGFYMALSPRMYVEGAVRLVPPNRQDRAREVLQACGRALWLWMLGRAVVMVLVAVVTTIGLLAIGVPLALPLGLLAGLLEFVPFFGSILAGIPVILVALTVDPQTALYAFVLVLVIQQAEGNVFEPIVERKAVSLPPALILIAAVAFTLVFGVGGAVFATPLLVVVMVMVKMLYQQDVLGERVKVPGQPA